MTKKRKGAITFEQIAVAVIVLIAIVVIIFVFRGQISNLIKGYTEISPVGDEAGQKCKVLYAERKCADQKPGDEWEQLPKPKDGWSDCKKKDSNLECWEKS